MTTPLPAALAAVLAPARRAVLADSNLSAWPWASSCIRSRSAWLWEHTALACPSTRISSPADATSSFRKTRPWKFPLAPGLPLPLPAPQLLPTPSPRTLAQSPTTDLRQLNRARGECYHGDIDIGCGRPRDGETIKKQARKTDARSKAGSQPWFSQWAKGA